MLEASNQFYPTPKNVAEIMKSKVTIRIGRDTEVVDTSAGTGSLLDLYRKSREDFNDEYGYRKYLDYGERCTLYAIEIDLDLRYTLQGKDIKVIGSDFLEWTEAKKFDLVIMNPPFNQGVRHVLKAWDLVKSGGQLIALLNSETTTNLCNEKRKLLYSFIEQFGSVESLGSCFSEADRPTDIDISLIVLNKPILNEEQKNGEIIMSTKHVIIIRSRDCDDQNYSESETQIKLLELIDPLKSNEFDVSIKPIGLSGYNSCFEVVVDHHINQIIQILAPFCAPGQAFYVMSINSSYDD